MKARLPVMPKKQKDKIKAEMKEMIETEWEKIEVQQRDNCMRHFYKLMCYCLNDMYHFGEQKLYRLICAMGELAVEIDDDEEFWEHLDRIVIDYLKVPLDREEDYRTTGGKKPMKVMLDDGAIMPTRAHATDAGLDLYSRETLIVPAKGSAVFDTGVHIQLPHNTVGMLKSKSGLNVKHGITSEGVIDVGYTGSIKVKLYNNGGYDYAVNTGDKISQLVVIPIITPLIENVKELDNSERGCKGFGSTGK